jgi:hypothetical protein
MTLRSYLIALALIVVVNVIGFVAYLSVTNNAAASVKPSLSSVSSTLPAMPAPSMHEPPPMPRPTILAPSSPDAAPAAPPPAEEPAAPTVAPPSEVTEDEAKLARPTAKHRAVSRPSAKSRPQPQSVDPQVERPQADEDDRVLKMEANPYKRDD